MSMAEKYRHSHLNHREESKARSNARKYEMKKMAVVVNHVEYERHHGFESAKRGEKKSELS
jgi:hypothetical protein